MSNKKRSKKEPRYNVAVVKNVTVYVSYLFIVWGLYRSLFKLPDEIEELVIKPIIWLVPIFFLLKKEKEGLKSIGITGKNIISSIYYSLFLGVIFALEGFLINLIKYNKVDFSANLGPNPFLISLGLSLATAISEEISFRGYVFGRLRDILKNEWIANLLVSVVWAVIHIPIIVFWWKLSLTETLGYMILTSIFGFGSAYIYARTGNIVSSILLHVMWQWPIALFR